MQSNQGFWKAYKPYFMTREVGVHEMDQNFRSLQLVQLRQYERDVVLQTFGLPPELLGVLDNSNRATISSADYLMSRYVTQPRLEFLRTVLQEKLVPEFDDRLILDYDSPIEADHDAELAAATVAPWAQSVDEWRKMQGLDPMEDEAEGKLHMIPSTVTVTTLADAVTRAAEKHELDMTPPPPPIIAPGGIAPGKPPKPGQPPRPGAPKPPKPGTPPKPGAPKPAPKPPKKDGEPDDEAPSLDADAEAYLSWVRASKALLGDDDDE
jgi:hypothetical protein